MKALLPILIAGLWVQDAWKATDKAQDALKELEKKFEGKTHKSEAFGYIAHSAKCDDKQFERTNRFLRTYADFASKQLFDKPPTLLTVVSFQNADDFYAFAGRRGISGYYSPATKQLVNNLNDGLGTCAHEMTHALHDADWGSFPNGWFVEGLGATMENCLRKKDGTFVGIGFSHWRFPGVKQRINNGQIQPLRDHANQRQSDGNSYAQGRWVLTYLFHLGVLKEFIREFRSSHKTDASGITALEKISKKPLADFERDWKEWSKDLEVEIVSIRSSTLYPVLGMIGRNKPDGLEVAAVSPGSVADQAKIKPGDLLFKAGGAAIKTMNELLDVLKKQGDGAKIKLEYRRGEEDYSVTVTLDQYIDG
ncbi:MAG TPA: PDZ domain-containing protein [Planctomycetota bacterium]|nr:PDZ domain-containing protein [Planctomycetota bacterium]